jgi:hypothetical protein
MLSSNLIWREAMKIISTTSKKVAMIYDILAEPTKLEIDDFVQKALNDIPNVHVQLAFVTKSYGIEWLYHFKKQYHHFESELISAKPHEAPFIFSDFRNRLRLILSESDEVTGISWDGDVAPSHQSILKSNLSFWTVLSTVSWQIYRTGGIIASIFIVLAVILLLSLAPKVSILLLLVVASLDPEYLLPLSVASARVNEKINELPLNVTALFHEQAVIVGAFLNNEIMYLILGYNHRHSRWEVSHCSKALPGVYLSVYLTLNVYDLSISHLEVDVLQYIR